MKNYVVLFLFINFSVFSQNRNEINKIIGTYNTSELNNIKTSIIESNNQKQSRVNNYLLLNASKQESFVVNGVMYKMIDVIDNKPLYISTDNRNSALAVKTNNLYPGGNLGLNLTGAGMNIGVWDGGWALTTHEEFLNAGVSRITTPDAQTINPAAEFHATHVVGTIGASGININARGMAYESNIKSYNWTSDNTEVISEAANYGLLISNHSYGIPINSDDGSQSAPDWMMGNYNTDASQWDQISFNAPYYLEVTSAGNSGMDTYSNGLAPGLDKLTGEKNAKNNLVVANANPTVNPITGAITNLVINGSSSQGPSDDGRIKPDITADGTNVLSTIETSTTSYGTATGTSMS
uniref:S8 family serine peptidase n=1 Tax=uncultured Flavobacterium sp. TaxID=165435 RepID=UPI0030CA30A2